MPEGGLYKKNTRVVGKQRSNTRLQAERQQRRQRALELRMAGASYQQIVQANIGYSSVGHVGSDMKNILDSVRLESPENLVLLDLARLDDLQQVLTLHFHRGDVGLSSAIMQVMKFRHSLLGIDDESIRQRNLERTQVTNNGIMVVQGNTRDYLASMMEAAGLSPDEQERELRRLESAEGKETKELTSGRVIQGEVIPEVVPSETSSEKSSTKGKTKVKVITSSKGSEKGERKVLLRVRKKPEAPTGTPGKTSQEIPKATTATLTRSKGKGGTLSPRDTERPLEDRLVAFSEALDAEQQEQEAAELPVARLADPVIQVDLDSPELRRTIRERVLERDIKTPDNNVPVSPGVPYKAAPRKLSPAEGRALVLRKLGKPAEGQPGATAGRLVDRVPVETSQEEIP